MSIVVKDFKSLHYALQKMSDLIQTPAYAVRPRTRALCSMPVYSPAFTDTHCAYIPWGGQAELPIVAGYILVPIWFTCTQKVTHVT